MFEFSDKSTKNKFNKTDYGKKVSKLLYMSVISSLILIIVCFISFFIMSSELSIIKILLLGCTCISIIISCYFDGKRDGAIEQFKRISNK